MPARESPWAIYDVFETKDGEHLFVGVVSDSLWRKFCDLFQLTESEQSRLQTEQVAELVMAGAGLGAAAVKGGPGIVSWVKGLLGKNPEAIKFDGKFYSAGGIKIEKTYYDRLWEQGRPAPFLQVKEVLASSPKIVPDPRGMPGYYRYEGAGLEMIYNPVTGQVGHIQPLRR